MLEDEPVLAKTSDGRGAEVEKLISPTLSAMGFAIVRVLISGEKRPKLQVMVEQADGECVTLDHCASISRAIGAILDVEDPISGSYTLEVSSPGIDRPLTRLSDFDRFAGLDARVEMQYPIAGRRRFTGRIAGVEGANVLLEGDDGPVALDFSGIAKAKLLMTDELVAMHQTADSE